METWKILLIIFAASAVLGPLTGIIMGKVMLNREKPGYKPLLSKKERIIYVASILLGVALILFGVFYPIPTGGEAAGYGDEAYFAAENGSAV